MRIDRIAATVLACMALASPADAYFESSGGLREKLKACDKLDKGEFMAKEMFLCARGMGFVSALYDAAVTQDCSPEGMTQGEVVTTVRKALEAGGVDPEGPAYALALDTIHKVYPCPKTR